MEKDYMTAAEFGKWFKISRNTVYKYARSGELPATRFLQREWRFYHRDIARWMENQSNDQGGNK